MITGEKDDRVVALPCHFKSIENPCQLIIDLCDHGVIKCLDPMRVMFIWGSDFILEIKFSKLCLLFHVTGAEVWPGHVVGVKPIRIRFGRDEWRVRVVDIQIEQPWRIFMLPFADEVDRTFTCPRCLMHLRANAFCALPHCIKITSLLAYPVCVVMSFSPVITYAWLNCQWSKPFPRPVRCPEL